MSSLALPSSPLRTIPGTLDSAQVSTEMRAAKTNGGSLETTFEAGVSQQRLRPATRRAGLIGIGLKTT